MKFNLPPNIPSRPDKVYDEWENNGIWFGTGNTLLGDFFEFKKAKENAINNGIKSQRKYHKWIKDKKPEGMPYHPERNYKNSGWNGWGDFLGTGFVSTINRVFLSFEKARKVAISLDIKTKDKYLEWAKSDKRFNNMPIYPNETYKGNGWVNWANFLGT